MAQLLRYSWPGNVRELEREVKRAVLLAGQGELLDLDRFSERLSLREEEGLSLEDRLRAAERQEIERALAENAGNATKAAEQLEVPLSSFYRKVKNHGLGRKGTQL